MGTSSRLDRPSDEEADIDMPWNSFHGWLASDSDMYWISGKAGSGKSTLIKFILSTPLTQRTLERWSPNARVLSHFFWKPGQQMGNNVKGLYCSLLHQALSANPDFIDQLVAKIGRFAAKDSFMDWSINEPRSEVFSVLSLPNSSTCIFVDGLDEATCENEDVDLVEEIRNLTNLPHVKVCVSSRPEPQLQSRLIRYPHLRLQDLTAADLRRYAHEKLQFPMKANQIPTHARREIIWRLVKKANGVFLYLHLAIRRLLLGLQKGESVADLELRITQLPRELFHLYADMWSRLGNDQDLYKQRAARYLNLISSDRNLRILRSDYEMLYDGPSTVQLVLATQPTVVQALLDGQEIEDERLHALSSDVQKSVENTCAGLLEVVPGDVNYPQWKARLPSLEWHLNGRVAFIHRSAYDFLHDTEDGCRLLESDVSAEEERRFQLLQSRIAMFQFLRWIKGTIRLDIKATLRMICCVAPGEQLEKLFQLCHNGYETGIIPFKNRLQYKPHFFALSHYPQLFPPLKRRIADAPDPKKLATTVLQDVTFVMHTCYSEHLWQFNVALLLKTLLRLGADFYSPISTAYPGRSIEWLDSAFIRLLKFNLSVEFPDLAGVLHEVSNGHTGPLRQRTYVSIELYKL